LYFAAADMFDFADWESIKPLAHFVLANPSIDGLAKIETRQPSMVVVHTDNEIRDALVGGAARVIARGGVERATTQRISRASGLPPSALFTEYRTRQVLFSDVAEKLLRAIYRNSRAEEGQGLVESQPKQSNSTPTDYDDPRLIAHRHQVAHTSASHQQALIAPEGLEQRRIRLEFHLAAITDPEIHKALANADAAATQFTADQMNAAFGIPTEFAEPLMRMSRLFMQGNMLLEEISHFLHGRDMRYIYKPLGEAISLRVINADLTPSNN
jgi:AcrR family transcriptional regulator